MGVISPGIFDYYTDRLKDAKRYTREEALADCLQAYGGTEMPAEVVVNKYLLRDEEGLYLETRPAHMHRRFADIFAWAAVERDKTLGLYEGNEDSKFYKSDFYFNLFSNGKGGFGRVILQGSPMSAIGNPFRIESTSNCFVISSPEDSYGGILKRDEQLAQIMKRRGGVGVDVSTLRPRNAKTTNAARTSTGPITFCKRYSNTTREVGQEGRRGALMIQMNCHHPDIREFIHMKMDKQSVTGANVSIQWTDEFLDAVVNDSQVELRFPVQSGLPDSDYVVREMVDARPIFMEFVRCARLSAEPGAVYLDNMLKGPSDYYDFFRYVCTNPCGEIGMGPNDSCRLVAMNFYQFIAKPFTKDARILWEELIEYSQYAQYINDLMVDIEIAHIQRIIDKVKEGPEPSDVYSRELELWERCIHVAETGRRTGLGPTGLADAMAACGIKYGSDESVAFTDKMYKSLAVGSYTMSTHLAHRYGAFPAYDPQVEEEIEQIKLIDTEARKLGLLEPRLNYTPIPRRNISMTTTAPTGSLSAAAEVSSGIENLWNVVLKRFRKVSDEEVTNGVRVDRVDALGDKWTSYNVYHKQYETWMKTTGLSEFEDSPWFGATTNDIDWLAGVKIQAAAQKWVTHSISKTANFPRGVTEEAVFEAYIQAWKMGCKGFTIYVDGSLDGVLVEVDKPAEATEASEAPEVAFDTHDAPKRPEELPVDFYRLAEDVVMFVGLYEGKPYEVFLVVDKNLVNLDCEEATVKKEKVDGLNRYVLNCRAEGGEYTLPLLNNAPGEYLSTLTRMLSMSLRHGVPLQYIVDQLLKNKDSNFNSFERKIARVLKCYIEDGAKSSIKEASGSCTAGQQCSYIYQEGCLMCTQCGASKCG